MIVLLIRQIAQLFLCILAGFILAKSGLIRGKDSKTLSVVALYLVNPCMIFSSFQIEYSDKVRDGLLLALVLAVFIHILLLIAVSVLGKAFHLSNLEKNSVMYSNAGNLIIPIVTSLFGQEYVIYSSAFVVVQTILLWTHARISISGEKKIDLKKIIVNVNMIAIFLGLLTFVTQIPIPGIVTAAASSIGAMIGPLCMIIAGILVSELNFQNLHIYKRLPMIGLRCVLMICRCWWCVCSGSSKRSWGLPGLTIFM